MKDLNIKMPSFFTKTYFSLFFIVLGLVITIIAQYYNGAKIVYFLPDYPITRTIDSESFALDPEDASQAGPYYGFSKCEFYGSCLNMDYPTNFDIIPIFLLSIISYYAFISGTRKTKLEQFLGLLYIIISYILVFSAQSLSWFRSCTDFCGLEYFFLWIVPFAFFIIGAIISWYRNRSVHNNNLL